jgi:hypothetical protein
MLAKIDLNVVPFWAKNVMMLLIVNLILNLVEILG